MVIFSLSLHGLFSVPVSQSLLIRTFLYWIRSAHMTSVYLHYLFKGPISKYGHFLRYWGSRYQHMNLGGMPFSPIFSHISCFCKPPNCSPILQYHSPSSLLPHSSQSAHCKKGNLIMSLQYFKSSSGSLLLSGYSFQFHST